MNKDEQIRALAELDGWKLIHRPLLLSGGMDADGSSKKYIENHYVLKHGNLVVSAFDWETPIPSVPKIDDALQTIISKTPYLTSRDAIVPLIEKQPEYVKARIVASFWTESLDKYDDFIRLLLATPPQLAEALLRASGKWQETK